MKYLTIAAIAATVAFSGIASAQQAAAAAPTVPANKTDCEKAKMKWDDKGGKDAKGICVATTPAAAAPAPAVKK